MPLGPFIPRLPVLYIKYLYIKQHIKQNNSCLPLPGMKLEDTIIENIHILPNWAESINETIIAELMIKSIHGTLAIEGNPSTEKEIEKTISALRQVLKEKDMVRLIPCK